MFIQTKISRDKGVARGDKPSGEFNIVIFTIAIAHIVSVREYIIERRDYRKVCTEITLSNNNTVLDDLPYDEFIKQLTK